MIYSLCSIVALFATVFAMRNDYSTKNLRSQVTNLPGLPSSANYTMFSGYITVDSTNNRNLFYWFVESLNDPVNDPLVLWTNGGPGCSGLLGFFTENGPFAANENTTLYINPYSWVNVANMLFIEAPAGVGFSYSDVKSDYETDDNKTAIDNYNFIRGWLDEFTNYKNNKFYISSESYGGHYMPTLAQQITIGNNAGNTPHINFYGVFVGNPFTDPVENAIGQYDTWYGHSLISRPLWVSWYQNCHNGNATHTSPKCDEMEVILTETVGNIDPYALDFPVCNSIIGSSEKYHFLKNVIRNGLGRKLPKYWENKVLYEEQYGIFPNEDYYQACSENYATVYLNLKDVQTAIHAQSTIWKGCSDTIVYSQTSKQSYMEPTWKWLVAEADLHMTVVSGDDDSVCGTMGTQSWMWYLGYHADPNYNWTAWTDQNGQVGGYQTKFLTSDNKPAINLVTVHSAGHMIPQTQPERSLETFTKFLAGTF